MSRYLTSRRARRCETRSTPDIGFAKTESVVSNPLNPEEDHGETFVEAEQNLLVIDTQLAEVQTSQIRRADVRRDALIAANLFAITEDFLCSRPLAATWWRSQPLGTLPLDHIAVSEAISLISGDHLWSLLDRHVDVAYLWQRRSDALAHYGQNVSTAATETVMRDLLQAHCVRMRVVDSVTRETCLRLAGVAAESWRAVDHSSRR